MDESKSAQLEEQSADVWDEELESPEEIRVRGWRFEQFTALGFDAPAVVSLVGAPVDLHQARRLIGAGCPPATAAAILL